MLEDSSCVLPISHHSCGAVPGGSRDRLWWWCYLAAVPPHPPAERHHPRLQRKVQIKPHAACEFAGSFPGLQPSVLAGDKVCLGRTWLRATKGRQRVPVPAPAWLCCRHPPHTPLPASTRPTSFASEGMCCWHSSVPKQLQVGMGCSVAPGRALPS